MHGFFGGVIWLVATVLMWKVLHETGTSPALEVRVQRSALQGTGEKDSTASEEIELPAEPTEEGGH